MFYDKFVSLCDSKGVSPSRAAMDAGLSRSNVSKWKSNPDSMPTGTVIEKLTQYFGVSVAELMEDGPDVQKNKPAGTKADRLASKGYDDLTAANRAVVDALIETLLRSQS